VRKVLWVVLGLVMLLALAACSASGSTTAAPTKAPVSIALVTEPDPAVVGDVELQFTVVDENGQPISAADFDVFADHTDHSGMTLHGKATDQGNGLYAITANFSMSGNWKLSVQVKKDTLDYKEDIPLKIQ